MARTTKRGWSRYARVRPAGQTTVNFNPGVVMAPLDACDHEARTARLSAALSGFPISANEAATWNRLNPACPLQPSPVAPSCPAPPVFASTTAASEWTLAHPGCPPGVYVPPVSSATLGIPTWAWWVAGFGVLGFAGMMLTNAKGRRA